MILVWTQWKACRTGLCRKRPNRQRVTSQAPICIKLRSHTSLQIVPTEKMGLGIPTETWAAKKSLHQALRARKIISKEMVSSWKPSRGLSPSLPRKMVTSASTKNVCPLTTNKTERFRRLQSSLEWVVIKKYLHNFVKSQLIVSELRTRHTCRWRADWIPTLRKVWSCPSREPIQPNLTKCFKCTCKHLTSWWTVKENRDRLVLNRIRNMNSWIRFLMQLGCNQMYLVTSVAQCSERTIMIARTDSHNLKGIIAAVRACARLIWA